MTVRLAREWNFSATLVSDRYDRPVINTYTLRVEMATQAQDNINHNLAYGRLRYWFHEVMEGGVIIAQDHPTLEAWRGTGAPVLVFPEDPVDQLVGIMLYHKLQAIVQDQMAIDSVSISSPLDDDVIYHHYAEEDSGPMGGSGWWQDPRPLWVLPEKPQRGKVVSLPRVPTWRDLELDWYQDTDQSPEQDASNET